MEGGTGG